jgi:hypothetical protein
MNPGYTGDVRDNQAIFDYVLGFITKQGKRSMENDMCMYRGVDEGSACAAGCLIPDADYRPEFDKGNGKLTVVYDAKGQNAVSDYFLDRGFDPMFLRALQRAHDCADDHNFEATFHTYMSRFAEQYNLTFTKPQ